MNSTPNSRKRHRDRYNDAYRELFNETLQEAAAPFHVDEEAAAQHYGTQIGASRWSPTEKAVFFAALQRLGQDDAAGISQVIGTKTILETQDLLLLLKDAAAKQSDAKITLRDVPAAIEIGNGLNDQLTTAGETLAWHQEQFEASEEKARYGDYWLITSEITNLMGSTSGGLRRDLSPSTEPGTPRKGSQIARSCQSCRRHKKRCDLKIPCTNCASRRKPIECVYGDAKERRDESVLPDSHTEDEDEDVAFSAFTDKGIFKDIPEAILLQPEMMLELSRNLFMNRSPTIPSPWKHWIEYVSDTAEEPAIYRSALIDFHNLAIYQLKRLVQVALIQATSRLRSQRRRVKKQVLPLVKRRDVLAAIDLLDMKRDGKDRWKGTARRCGVRVYDRGRGRKKDFDDGKEMSWDEVEHLMSIDKTPDMSSPVGPETSDDDNQAYFKARANRSGTPLPMSQLNLDDSNEDSGQDSDSIESDSDDIDEAELDEGRPDSAQAQCPRGRSQARDIYGRYADQLGEESTTEQQGTTMALEQFDQEASKLEAEALRTILELSPPVHDTSTEISSPDMDEHEEQEKIITDQDGWREWIEYRAEWEHFSSPIPEIAFKHEEAPTPYNHEVSRPTSVSSHHSRHVYSSDDSSDNMHSRRRTRNQARSVELQAQDPHAYAAAQGRVSEWNDLTMHIDDMMEQTAEGEDSQHPVQSIEDGQELQPASSASEMDWSMHGSDN